MKFALAIVVLSLSGCEGTIDQNRARTPSATFVTRLSEPTLEHCLAGKLSWLGTPTIIRGDNSTEIAFDSPYGTALLLTIMPAGSGSRVELRMKHDNYLHHLSGTVESCL